MRYRRDARGPGVEPSEATVKPSIAATEELGMPKDLRIVKHNVVPAMEHRPGIGETDENAAPRGQGEINLVPDVPRPLSDLRDTDVLQRETFLRVRGYEEGPVRAAEPFR